VLLPPIGEDPRLAAGVSAFNAGDFDEAGDVFEELFLEAVRDEVPFARALLQVSVGFLHAERGQTFAAVSRLEEALLAMRQISDPRGLDFARLREDVVEAIGQLRAGCRPRYPMLAPQHAQPAE
jgi:predicted metal-dependent hydrolase